MTPTPSSHRAVRRAPRVAPATLATLGAGLVLAGAACGGRARPATGGVLPVPSALRVPLAAGSTVTVRMLRDDGALELVVLPAPGSASAPAIMPMAGAAARGLATHLLSMAPPAPAAIDSAIAAPAAPVASSGTITTVSAAQVVSQRARDAGGAPDASRRGAAATAAAIMTNVELELVDAEGAPVHVLLTRREARRLGHGLRMAAAAVAEPHPDSARAYLGPEVDSLPTTTPGMCAPSHPPALRQRGVTGEVETEFVIDSAGRVEMASLQVLHASDPAFERAVRAAMGCFRFVPARVAGRAVRFATFQAFHFDLSTKAGHPGEPVPLGTIPRATDAILRPGAGSP